MNRLTFLNIVSALLICMGCGVSCQWIGGKAPEDKVLVKANNKMLYLSELDGMFPDGTSSSDSALIISAYAERWIREALLLHEAERNIPSDLNIDKLVRDYRASLIRNNYEKILVEELLDSMITQDELHAFYEKNKEQYQLETPIVRCYLVKVPLPVPEAEKLRDLWSGSDNKKNFSALVNYCNSHAEAHLLDKATWYSVEDIAEQLPKGTLTADNISAKLDFIQRDGRFEYLFKVFEVKNRKDIAPLEYIEEQARKYILHQRKIKLLEQKKEEMYERAIRRGNVQVYYEEN
ncbi:MAG: hypothetical protein ACKV1O_30150 [Saprospiraceae bacterium]